LETEDIEKPDKLLPDNNHLLEKNNNRKDVAMVCAALIVPIDNQSTRMLMFMPMQVPNEAGFAPIADPEHHHCCLIRNRRHYGTAIGGEEGLSEP